MIANMFNLKFRTYQVKSYGINHSLQTASPYFPTSRPAARFSTPNQTMHRRQSLDKSQPYNTLGNFTNYLNKKNL